MTLLLANAPVAFGAPAADLWPRWRAHDPDSTATIDHGAFDRFLNQYVVRRENGPNGVRYGAVREADKKRLARYIRRMESVPIDHYSRPVQRAFWINLYNAETLRLILTNYPVDSIRDLGSFLSSGPWDEKVLTVEGEKLSLNDIEHRILRPIWHDTLTHYGVNCASISCPSLLPAAYTGETVNARLRANRRAYINSPQGVRLKHGRLTLSKIYDWYAADFGATEREIIAGLRRYARPALAAKLKDRRHIDDYAYDWSLNAERAVERLPAIGGR